MNKNQNTDNASIAYRAGQEAKRNGVSLKNSAIRNLRVGSKQYDDFLVGFDSLKKTRA